MTRTQAVGMCFGTMVIAVALSVDGSGAAGALAQQPTEFPTVPPTETVPALPSDIPTPAAETPTPTMSPTASPSPSPTPTRRVTPVSPTPTQPAMARVFLPRALNGLLEPDPAAQ